MTPPAQHQRTRQPLTSDGNNQHQHQSDPNYFNMNRFTMFQDGLLFQLKSGLERIQPHTILTSFLYFKIVSSDVFVSLSKITPAAC